jgi:hypothetical protein
MSDDNFANGSKGSNPWKLKQAPAGDLMVCPYNEEQMPWMCEAAL